MIVPLYDHVNHCYDLQLVGVTQMGLVVKCVTIETGSADVIVR